jgi:glycerol-3-phosphate dehydrogenase
MSKRCRDIERKLQKIVFEEIICREWHSSIVLEGEVHSWKDVISAGKLAAKKGYKGVVNKITVKGFSIPKIKEQKIKDNYIHNKHIDVLIIGGGVIGCSIARELSKWDISILLVDKEEDLAMHTSSRNDGMIHPGINPKPGTKKAYYNVKGNKMYSQITKDLEVDFTRRGSIILFDKKFIKLFYPIFNRRAQRNGVEGLEFLSKQKVKELEPNILNNIEGGIRLPTTGILSPYKMTVAFGENAALNGVEFSLNTIVKGIKNQGRKIISVTTNRGTVYPRVVINAAGVYSDKIADMADDQFFTIHPRKGEIVILDKKVGNLITHVLGMPDLFHKSKYTKGGGLVRTIEDNILVGPDAYEQPYRENYSTNRINVSNILKKHLPIVPKLSFSDSITYFSGIRAATYEEDFIVEKSEYLENMIYAAGIQSPGLASAPAIAEDIAKITCDVLLEYMKLNKKKKWNPYRKGIPELSKLNTKERNTLIKNRPDYGTIICRCEEISKGEIIDAIHSPIPVNTVDGIKRRVRAGMGRCQGGFCMPLVLDIIREETNKDALDITKKGKGSYLLVEETKRVD